ncbi:MAG: DUF4169 family protein [Caulobacterales bacterium]
MSQPVSLNRARKAKARSEDKVRAAQNRARFGRSKAQKALESATSEKTRRDVDGAKREP